MSGHQYQDPRAYREGASARGDASQQPIDAYNALQAPQYQNYARTPPRRPVAPYARQPPPAAVPTQPYPSKDAAAGPYTAYRPRTYDAPEEHRHEAAAPAVVGSAVAGGVGGTAAGSHARQASAQNYQRNDGYSSHPPDQSYSNTACDQPYHTGHPGPKLPPHSRTESEDSFNTANPFSSRNAGMAGSESSLAYDYGHGQSMRRNYRGDGYDEFVDPRDIADDGDDGFVQQPSRSRGRMGLGGAGVGGGTVLENLGPRNASGKYGPVGGNDAAGAAEKSEWLQSQSSRKKKWRWIIIILVAIVVIGAIVAGILVGVVFNNDSSPSRGSASGSNGLWDIDSSEVKAVLDNKNLHRVFPGMDYTPQGAQYPACLSNMPYQNDVTLDVAVLAQLTPAIRLYGTDCEQTEMVLKGIDLLGYNETVKVWLGVWLGDNTTTNTRQLEQMYTILDTYPAEHFAGVIVGNEVLFREDLTITQLADQLAKVRQELSSRSIDLPVATSDLGDDWTAALAADSDIVMSNVHPFFAGVTPDEAPGWTWTFWQTHDVILKTTSGGKWPANIISETGWPSQGGNDCGTGEKCPTKTAGAVAGIDELNKFMDGWVCPSLSNGTTYFWFEAFDEPWKEIFNDAKTGDFWEPHWGLMDVDRNLKQGLKIPDCGGQTIDTPY